MTTSVPPIGVVIGRFQVPHLHPGHVELLRAASMHPKTIVLLTVSPHLVTRGDPLDFPTRALMIHEAFPLAIVLPIADEPTDTGWSASVDRAIETASPIGRALLYFGRDSSFHRYHGRHATHVIAAKGEHSGSALRAQYGARPRNGEEFRAGAIYAAHNMWPRAVAVVDVAMTRHSPSGELELLLGRRRNEGGLWRLPGGHVDVNDESAEQAARRELAEETGLEAGAMRIVGNYRVRGWRKSEGYELFTTLFHAEYQFGAPEGRDDMDGALSWVAMKTLPTLQYADDHEMLVTQLLASLLGK